MPDDPVADDWVIIVHLWWEQTDTDDVAMRARVTSSANGTIVAVPRAAATVDGVLQALRVSVEQFLQNPPTTGVAHG